jgi:hypothetical protein
MNIRTEFWAKPIPTTSLDWSAIDYDTYDGAPDSGPRARLIGYGPTEEDAIADLHNQIADLED